MFALAPIECPPPPPAPETPEMNNPKPTTHTNQPDATDGGDEEDDEEERVKGREGGREQSDDAAMLGSFLESNPFLERDVADPTRILGNNATDEPTVMIMDATATV